MSHFIKLQAILINKLHIIQIIKQPKNIYHIHMTNNIMDGFVIGDMFIEPTIIKIDETHNKIDYDTVSNFIDKQ